MSYTPTTWANGDTITAQKMNNIEQGVESVNMSYTPTTWANGDTITAQKMNNIEQGIVDASSGGGDLSTAQVTFTTDRSSLPVQVACLIDVEGYAGVDIATPANGDELTMPLYKGYAYAYPNMNLDPPPSLENFSVSGAITIDDDEGVLVVAGDGTVTYTWD